MKLLGYVFVLCIFFNISVNAQNKIKIIYKSNPNTTTSTPQAIDPKAQALFNNLVSSITKQNFGDFSKLLPQLKNYNMKDLNGNTLLHLCILANNPYFMREILKYPVNVNVQNNKEETPFYLLARTNNFDSIAPFIKKGGNPNIGNLEGDFPLIVAIYSDNKNFINTLLATGKVNINNQNKYGLSALHLAAYRGLYGNVETFISYKANVNIKDVDGITPLHFAAGNGHLVSVTDLVKAHALIDAKDNAGNTPLYNAVVEGQNPIVEFLIKKKADILFINKKGKSLLQSAVNAKQVDTVKLLLSYNKINVNIKDKSGNTALMTALAINSSQSVSLLLPLSDINLTNNLGQNALMLSFKYKNEEAINFILNSNYKNFTATDIGLNNLVHYAVKNNENSYLDLLNKNKVGFFAKNSSGKTPLDLAVENNNGVALDYYITHFKAFMKNKAYVIKLENTLIKNGNSYLARKLKKVAYNYNNPQTLVSKNKPNVKSSIPVSKTTQKGISYNSKKNSKVHTRKRKVIKVKANGSNAKNEKSLKKVS